MITDHFDHLSPSNVNAFIGFRTKWFLERIEKRMKFTGSPETERGKAVEKAATVTAMGGSFDDALADALEAYDATTGHMDADKVAACREPIKDMAREVANELEALAKSHGKIVDVQRSIETGLPGPNIPWLMFTDVEFEDGLIVDIKTKGRTPSALPASWARQGAAYSKASEGRPVGFVCAIPLKKGVQTWCHTMTPEEIDLHFQHLIEGANRMARLLNADPWLLPDIFAPDPEDWSLKDEDTFNAAAEVWPWLRKEAA